MNDKKLHRDVMNIKKSPNIDKMKFKKFLPNYDRLTLYVHAITFLLLFFYNENFRNYIFEDYKEFEKHIFLFVMFFSGIILSIINVFLKGEIDDLLKTLMLFFIILSNFYIAFYTFNNSINNNIYTFEYIIISFNTFWSMVMIILFRIDIINDKNISDDDVPLYKVFIITFAVGVLLFILNNIAIVDWNISYATIISITFIVKIILNQIKDTHKFRNSDPNQTMVS
jgi:hypothetical protein